MLQSTLERDGNNLAFANTANTTSTLFIDIANSRVGINSNVANVTLDVAGNIAATNLSVTGNVTATSNITGGNITTVGLVSATGNVTGGNITINNTTILTSLANANITLQPNGTGLITINTTTGLLLPVGNTIQRPGYPTYASTPSGLIRYNNALDYVEYYDGIGWVEVSTGSGNATITDQQITPDGSNVTYTLDQASTQASIFVNLNGVGQLPGTAYTVTGNSITFAQVPETTDIIDIRFLASATTKNEILNSSGNTKVQATDTNSILFTVGGSNVATITSTGLSVTGNITGNVVIDNIESVTGNISAGNLLTTGLTSATGNVIGGNVLTGGLISATGNITANYFLGNGALLTGVITSSANINSGNSNVTILTSGGNILVGIGGANIVRFTGAGIENGQGNGTGNIGNASGYFNTVFARATSAQYADLAEMYSADAVYAPGTVLSFGGSAEVTQSDKDADPTVAGVVSENPAYIMNAGLISQQAVALALTGRVKCQVQGTVQPGAMMVSAGNGRARAEVNPAMGTVIGKALEAFDGAEGTIEVVVGRL